MRWLPERRLRMQGFESQYSWHELPRELVPDGIFISSKGERIAFEIETTPRKKSRYEDKRDGFFKCHAGDGAAHSPGLLGWVHGPDILGPPCGRR